MALICCTNFSTTLICYGLSDLRSTLHPDGANPFETLLTQVTTLSVQLHSTALEVLKLKEVHLEIRTRQNNQ